MDDQKKHQKIKDSLSMLLLGVGAVFAILTVANVIAFSMEQAPQSVLTDPCNAETENPDSKKQTKSEELAVALKKKNMFMPSPPKPEPPKEVKGILGNQALIKGKWYKVGDKVPPGAEIVAIEATLVRIKWKGKELTLEPIKAKSSGDSRKTPKKEKKKKRAKPTGVIEEKPKQEQPQEQAEEDDLAWLDIPEHLKEKFRKLWDKMTPEQKEKMKEQWNNMSEDEKEQALEAWNQRL